jgi:hypothetical protein
MGCWFNFMSLLVPCRSEILPGKFVMLLSPLEDIRRLCLNELRDIWELLQVCEMSAVSDPWATDFLKHLVFPNRTFDREILIMLAEERFTSVTPEIRNLVEGFADAWHSTNINEDMMNQYRQREQAQSAGECGRLSRWHVAASSTLISDYDRTVPLNVAVAVRLYCSEGSHARYQECCVAAFSLGWTHGF